MPDIVSAADTSLTRRVAVQFGAGGFAATVLSTRDRRSVAAQHASPTASENGKGPFVLVPGQRTGAFIWYKVAPLLRAAGHDVYPVTCTGLDDRVHLANPAIFTDIEGSTERWEREQAAIVVRQCGWRRLPPATLVHSMPIDRSTIAVNTPF